MKCIELGFDSIPEWASFFPFEVFAILMRRKESLHIIGAEFLGEPQGALVWEKINNEAIIRSIYVHPDVRRLGLGTALMAELSAQLVKYRCQMATISYTEHGEQMMLTPFLTSCGTIMDSVDMPLGSVDLDTASTMLESYSINKTTKNVFKIHTLGNSQRHIFREWLSSHTGESPDRYFSDKPASFVCMNDDNIIGALLFSDHSTALMLDYCWISPENPAVMKYILFTAVDSLKKQYSPDMLLDMFLSTPQSENLFEHMFGEVKDTVTFQSGTFFPQPPQFFSDI